MKTQNYKYIIGFLLGLVFSGLLIAGIVVMRTIDSDQVIETIEGGKEIMRITDGDTLYLEFGDGNTGITSFGPDDLDPNYTVPSIIPRPDVNTGYYLWGDSIRIIINGVETARHRTQEILELINEYLELNKN